MSGRMIWSEVRDLRDGVDLGTPPRDGEPVTLRIDGIDTTVPAGSSVLLAATAAGATVPKLCATDTLECFGSCRVCLVEIEGRRGYPASCTTPVEAGMDVRTQSEQLTKLRRGVVELYLSDYPADDIVGGWSEFHTTLAQVGLADGLPEGHVYRDAEHHHHDGVLDESNPYFLFDQAKCIVCSRCVRACEEIQGTFALTIDGRGFSSKVSPSQAESFLSSECVSCGACVQACPSDALIEKRLFPEGYHRADSRQA
jgi:predicted molibdopterin-dependent oxidoreductase YjgC